MLKNKFSKIKHISRWININGSLKSNDKEWLVMEERHQYNRAVQPLLHYQIHVMDEWHRPYEQSSISINFTMIATETD